MFITLSVNQHSGHDIGFSVLCAYLATRKPWVAVVSVISRKANIRIMPDRVY